MRFVKSYEKIKCSYTDLIWKKRKLIDASRPLLRTNKRKKKKNIKIEIEVHVDITMSSFRNKYIRIMLR